jgi:hypothetical protein
VASGDPEMDVDRALPARQRAEARIEAVERALK